MIAIGITLILAFGLFLAISQPLELREGRWLKVGFSLASVLVIALTLQNGLSYAAIPVIFLFVGVCFLWSPNLAHGLSNLAINSLFGGCGKGSIGGFRPDYREARAKIDAEQWDAAIALVQHELTKSPTDYEGRALLAALYHEKKLPSEAIVHLEVILHNPHATDAQKSAAAAAKHECLALVRDSMVKQ